MSRQWYYLKDGKTEGPIPEEAFRSLLKSGLLGGDTPVWHEDLGEWKKASEAGLLSSEMKGDILSQRRYAGFWIRTLAILIDTLILTAVTWIITSFFVPFILMVFAAGKMEGLSLEEILLAGATGAYCIYIFLTEVLYWLYFSILESSKWQASVGKKLLKLKVTDEEGKRITFLRATGRYFAKILSGLIFGIGFMMAGWSKKKQALHDRIADTVVIRES